MPDKSYQPTIEAVARTIDSVNEWLGRILGWLVLAMALTMFGVVLLRYGFGVGSIAWQESVNWMHGLVFMLGAAYTLKHDGHVRVDVFYQHWSARRRAWVDLCGALLLLLPMALLLLIESWHYVVLAWSIGEDSPEVGGLPALYLFKTAIPLAALLLILQGVAQALRSFLILRRTTAGATPADP